MGNGSDGGIGIQLPPVGSWRTQTTGRGRLQQDEPDETDEGLALAGCWYDRHICGRKEPTMNAAIPRRLKRIPLPPVSFQIHGVTIMDNEAARGEFEDTPLCMELSDYLYQALASLGLPNNPARGLWLPNSYDVTIKFETPQALDNTDFLLEGTGHDLDIGTHQYFFYLTPPVLKQLREDFNKHTPAATWHSDCMDKDLLLQLHLNGDF